MGHINGMGQLFYDQEANVLFPQGCKCQDGSCDWCGICYNGVVDVLQEQKDEIRRLREKLEIAMK